MLDVEVLLELVGVDGWRVPLVHHDLVRAAPVHTVHLRSMAHRLVADRRDVLELLNIGLVLQSLLVVLLELAEIDGRLELDHLLGQPPVVLVDAKAFFLLNLVV